ncbi:Transient receptor potential cation channel subfamily A member 1 [Trichoplax sp. H2]|nr:Transient receptor potential cation channel subfamily A member 1 [Trichoplax sp. H2]|eukprot:RDD42068.1 Transient receptor potential cation channel subfamily A member 1 [Trichoplax sp. H2]
MISRLLSNIRRPSQDLTQREALPGSKFTSLGDTSVHTGLSSSMQILHAINQVIRDGDMNQFNELLLSVGVNLDILNRCDHHGYSPLHYAAYANKVEIAKKLLSKKANINKEGIDKLTPLHIAAKYNAVEVIPVLLEKKAHINAKSKNELTPLHLAARKGHQESVKLLLEAKGIDVSAAGEDGITPLHLAMIGGNIEVSRLLLSSNNTGLLSMAADGRTPIHFAASAGNHDIITFLISYVPTCGFSPGDIIDKSDGVGNTALHLAVQYGHKKAVEVCLNNNAKINEQTFNLTTPLHLAAQNGHDEIIVSLLNAGSRVNIEDADGLTPLNRAALFGRPEAVSVLINKVSNKDKIHGAVIDSADEEGFTPLINACRKGHQEVVDILLNNKVDTQISDGSERTCLHWAVLSGNIEIIRLLINCNSKELIGKADRNGSTPFHYSAEGGYYEILDFFLQNKANPTKEDDEEHTPLHLAAMNGHTSCVSILLAADSSIINDANIKGQTPVHLACKRGHIACVKVLLQYGANLSRTDDYRLSPLEYTAIYGHPETMKILLESKASINTTDRNKNTPLHLAAKYGNTKIIRLLLDNGADITALNDRSQTCLDVAIENKRKEAAVSFVKHRRWHEILEDYGGNKEPPMKKLIEVLPEAAKVVLDRSIESSPLPEKHPNYTITYNYQYIDTDPADPRRKGQHYSAMKEMVDNDREDLLNHPLCQSLLSLKWNLYGRWFFMLNLLSYVFFLTLLTTFASATATKSYNLTFYCRDCCNRSYQPNLTAEFYNLTQLSQPMWFIKYITFGFGCFGLLKEIVQLVQQGGRYFNFENALEWVLYFSSFLYLFPFSFDSGVNFFQSCPPIKSQLLWGSIAIVLAWINMLLYFKRFTVGIYVVMFVTVLKNVLKVLILFSMFIIGFGLSFYRVSNVLRCTTFNNNCTVFNPTSLTVFGTPTFSMIKSFIMMQGEFEFVDDFVTGAISQTPNQRLTYPYFTFAIFVIFVIIMAIVLMNMMVGLAVGDIEAVQKFASLSRIKRQVESFDDMESVLPISILKLAYRPKVVAKPNVTRSKAYEFFKLAQKKIEDYTSEYFESNTQDRQTDLVNYFQDEIETYKKRIASLHGYMTLQTEVLMKINSKLCKKDGKASTLRTPRPSSAQPLPSRIADELINIAKTATEPDIGDEPVVASNDDDHLSAL